MQHYFCARVANEEPSWLSRQWDLSILRAKLLIASFPAGVNANNGNNGRLPAVQSSSLEGRYKCYCETDTKKDEKEIAREERRRLKEERLKKKERKLRKKAKLEKECLTEKMNCFEHDNDHWRTAPLWSAGPFCFCMNANNNTYSCIRTINVTHNFLYCEFTTGLVTFYNLRIGECDERSNGILAPWKERVLWKCLGSLGITYLPSYHLIIEKVLIKRLLPFSDPFEQWNRVSSLTLTERSYLHDQLEHLKGCKGTRDCTVGSAKEAMPQLQQHQRITKRKYSDPFGKFRESNAMHNARIMHVFALYWESGLNYFSGRDVYTIDVTNYARGWTCQRSQQKTEEVAKVSRSLCVIMQRVDLFESLRIVKLLQFANETFVRYNNVRQFWFQLE